MVNEKNPVLQLSDLYRRFESGQIDRRTLLARAGMLGLPAAVLTNFARALPAAAQDASPEAGPLLPGGFQSMTRDEFTARLAEDYPFTTEEQTPGGTVIFGISQSSSLTTLMPPFANNFPTQDFVLLVFDTLVGSYPAGGAEFTPALADSFEIAEDGRTYTFHLNPNAVFHDGTPVTSADVVFSLESLANPSTNSDYTGTFNLTVESWEAIDDHTVQIVSIDAIPQIVFFANVFLYVIPKHIWEDLPVENWQTDPGATGQDPSRVVGSGPFKFAGIDEGLGIATFVPNENYYDKAPVIEQFIFQTWPDDTAAVEALRSGDIDILDSPIPNDVASLAAQDNLEVALYPSYLYNYFGYNLDASKTTLFQERDVRQALIFALDRQAMLDTIYAGLGLIADGPQPVLSEAFEPGAFTPVYTYDPELAASMLDGAGWVVGSDGVREKDGQKLAFEMIYGAGQVGDQIAAAMQDYWRVIGVEMSPASGDFDTVYLPAITESFDFDVFLGAFNWTSPNGDQSAMFQSDMREAGFNSSLFQNAEYDELSAAANVELDPEKRRDLLIQASQIVHEEAPVGMLWFRDGRVGYNVRLKNFTPTANGRFWSMAWVEVQS
ncbi:MAG: peptide ABC transporter substrate-binding protein [Thermomicrobiales bacterium]|jgi:peptide/nickel transport system substrate-binding protein|nr:peptide ABC transporter substrate-binding protein [Thermomicrobiales bacterium]